MGRADGVDTADAATPARPERPRVAPPAPPGVRQSVPPVDPGRFAPTPARPLRAKFRHLSADTLIQPHAHPWAQVALSLSGVIRTTAGAGTYLVPPSRALWIPPGVEHVVTVVEDADLHTLYLHQDAHHVGPDVVPAQQAAWRECRVLEVSNLLRELVRHLPTAPDQPPDERERHLAALTLDELRRARPVRLGIDLPADKRLRHLCEAVLADPSRLDTLDDWARETGASARTVARLFRSELGTTFVRWREQVLLAKALTLAARGRPMGVIAAELGYASASAFSAMVTRSVGMPPSRFFGQAG
ncbi:AraC family transcriptional regulator [Piscinibacter sakaiensis]|uniref:Transcriptional regulator, AraC family n=1 Tax=Piscinibacter sakaiensis TaxID=1547922 RepID=A0A0K8P3F4_PISS1|nr:transcriptional regulator, AraC family [Piscinibacter sakaiensis]